MLEGPRYRKLTFAVRYRCLRAIDSMAAVTRLASQLIHNMQSELHYYDSFDAYAVRQGLIEHILTGFLSTIRSSRPGLIGHLTDPWHRKLPFAVISRCLRAFVSTAALARPPAKHPCNILV